MTSTMTTTSEEQPRGPACRGAERELSTETFSRVRRAGRARRSRRLKRVYGLWSTERAQGDCVQGEAKKCAEIG